MCSLRFPFRFVLLASAGLAIVVPMQSSAHEVRSGRGHLAQDTVVHSPAKERRLERRTVAATASDAKAAASKAPGDPAQVGQWGPVVDWPVVGVHVALLPNGKVVAYDSVGDRATETYPNHDFTRATVWDPATGLHTPATVTTGFNIFCSGLAHLVDGTLFAAGGNKNAALDGIRQTHVFNADSNTWAREADMALERWYPSVTPLRNGEMLITEGGPDVPEVRGLNGSIRRLNTASLDLPLYPWIDVAPDGRAFYSGPSTTMRSLDPAGGGAWQTHGQRDTVNRDYGSRAVFDNGKILVAGGGASTASARVIDLNGPTPQSTATASMATGRRQHNLTVLADGTILSTGGNSSGAALVDLNNGVYTAELWSPATGQWRTLASMQVTRQYHSTALLLPDGRVLSSGGGICGDCDSAGYLAKNAEVFSPPYLFKNDGSGQLAPRPQITSAPGTVSYNAPFSISTPSAGSISKVGLVRLGAVTHSVNMEQRYVPLGFTASGGNITATAPLNANIAPPGVYMLFVTGSDGVPSVAKMVRVEQDTTAPSAPTPTDTDPDSPANDNNPEVKGSAEAGSTVRIYSTATCSGSPLATGPAAAYNGSGITTPVPGDQTTSLRATATDSAGNTSPCSSPLSYTEDSIAPSMPTITDTDPDSPANDNSPEVKGTAATGSTVKVYATADCSGSPLASGTAATFSGSGITTPVPGDQTTNLRATATDTAGNASGCSSSLPYTEDSTAPSAPTISDTDPDSPANDNNPEVKGTADSGSTVKLYATADCSGAPLASGSPAQFASPGITVTVPGDQTTNLRATATDAVGNASACSAPRPYTEDSTAPSAPTITDTDPDSPANDNNPEVKGSAEAGSTVRIYSTSDCSGAPLASGTPAQFASPGITVNLSGDQMTNLRATATDAVGNASACSAPRPYTEDSTAPSAPTISDTDPDSPANDNNPEVKGAAEAGSTVRIYSTGDCSGSPLATGSAAAFNGSGITTAVPGDQTTNLRATATDGAGNGSGCSSLLAYTEDSTAPSAPTLNDTDPDSPANDNNPEVKGSAESGSTVRIYGDAGCSGTVLAQGSAAAFNGSGITTPVPGDQTTNLRATATDPAGNSSPCSLSRPYTEDSTAPSAPTLNDTDPDSPANDNNPEVKGSAEAGSTVRIYSTSDCSGSPLASGTPAQFASPGITVAVPGDQTTNLRATATDAAANTSGCSSPLAYTEDSSAASTPTLTDTDPDSPANDNNPEVKGAAEAGSTVRIYSTSDCSGAPLASGTPAQFASPGITVAVPGDQSTNLRATATDPAGNTSPCSSPLSYTEDSTPPGRPSSPTPTPTPPPTTTTPRSRARPKPGPRSGSTRPQTARGRRSRAGPRPNSPLRGSPSTSPATRPQACGLPPRTWLVTRPHALPLSRTPRTRPPRPRQP